MISNNFLPVVIIGAFIALFLLYKKVNVAPTTLSDKKQEPKKIEQKDEYVDDIDEIMNNIYYLQLNVIQ